jgi:cytochrome P450
MPKAEAFIMETMRFGTLAPLGMVHSTLEATTLHGFKIPKGTMVHANLHSAHYDPLAWKEPIEFNPHRFLSSDKKSLIRNEAFLAFSHGKRGCPGEALAKNELFLFLVSILQKFTVSLHPDNDHMDLSPNMGVSATPKPHTLSFKIKS